MSALVSPNAAIQIVSVVSHGYGFYAIKFGGPTLEAFRAAGCIDDTTLAAFAGTRRRVHTHPNGYIERRRWYGRPISWRIIWRTSRAHALTLPGVTEALLEEALLESAGPVEARGMPCRAEASAVTRNRRVGRLQRPARWTAVGDKLVLVDWMAVQAAAISQRTYT